MFLNNEELSQLNKEVVDITQLQIMPSILDMLYRFAGCNKQILIDGLLMARGYINDMPQDMLFNMLSNCILSTRIKEIFKEAPHVY